MEPTHSVRGTVSDENNNLLPGAMVVVKGNTRKNTTTDINGAFVLEDVPANATLTISFMGYQSLDYPLEGRTAVRVSLTPEVMKLDDVIITGYQTLNRERATGSFGTITGKNMESKLQPNLS